MLDVRTLFVVMIATSLVLALAMCVAVGFRFRDGVGKWTGSLCVQALMFIFYGARGVWPDAISIVVPNALFVVFLSLQAAAILQFYGKALPSAWHLLPPLIVSGLFSLLLDNLPARLILSGMVFGAGMLALAFLVQRLHAAGTGSARWMLMVGYLLGSADLVARAIVAIAMPTLIGGLLSPGWFQGVNFLVGFAVILVTSLGFLLLHKERAEQSAQRLAITDPLTGTFNRRTFLELADKEIARAERSGSELVLIMLDLDHFKRVNDEYGHLGGDEVLRRLVQVLHGCLRREDLLVRYGGEEFCILVPNVALDQATLMAERARSAVQHARFTFNGWSIPVTISLGVAPLMRGKDQGIDQLVGRADEALYSAKKAGRNRVVSYPQNSTFAMLMMAQRT